MAQRQKYLPNESSKHGLQKLQALLNVVTLNGITDVYVSQSKMQINHKMTRLGYIEYIEITFTN